VSEVHLYARLRKHPGRARLSSSESEARAAVDLLEVERDVLDGEARRGLFEQAVGHDVEQEGVSHTLPTRSVTRQDTHRYRGTSLIRKHPPP